MEKILTSIKQRDFRSFLQHAEDFRKHVPAAERQEYIKDYMKACPEELIPTISLSRTNSKVSKIRLKKGTTRSWGLPAFFSHLGVKTCPGAGACAEICFARQGHYARGSTIMNRESNLLATFLPDFVDRFSARLKNVRLLRVHDSGDFYSSEYLNNMLEIANWHFATRFYAYTKSVSLFNDREPPENFSVVYSYGGKQDAEIKHNAPISKVFSTVEELKNAGYKNGSNTDYLAIYAKDDAKIGLVYHGVKSIKNIPHKVLEALEMGL